jgi:hypothetical protein
MSEKYHYDRHGKYTGRTSSRRPKPELDPWVCGAAVVVGLGALGSGWVLVPLAGLGLLAALALGKKP